MPSNLNKLKIKDIRDFGISTVEYKGFEIMATEDDGEIVLAAIVSYDENSDAHVSVLEICGDTMKEAKELLVLELNDIKHTSNEIKELAIKHSFVGHYDKLLNKLAAPKATKAAKAKTVKVAPVTKPVEVTGTVVKPLNARGAAGRDQVRVLAEENLMMSAIKFEQRGKYKDWYIMAADVEGKEFEQRLDVFKKSLRTKGIL
ncbi:hypothetical protein VPHK567_0242 [Vibrio phage K567]